MSVSKTRGRDRNLFFIILFSFCKFLFYVFFCKAKLQLLAIYNSSASLLYLCILRMKYGGAQVSVKRGGGDSFL